MKFYSLSSGQLFVALIVGEILSILAKLNLIIRHEILVCARYDLHTAAFSVGLFQKLKVSRMSASGC
jgi:hypothetical protein